MHISGVKIVRLARKRDIYIYDVTQADRIRSKIGGKKNRRKRDRSLATLVGVLSKSTNLSGRPE